MKMMSLEGEDSDSDDLNKPAPKYTIRIFGATKEGHSVCLTVTSYPVYFYIKVSMDYTRSDLNKIIRWIQGRLKPDLRSAVLKQFCSIELHKDFYGFKNGDKFKFFKLVFSNSMVMSRASNMFNNEVVIRSLQSERIKFQTYESNVDPIIRFVHFRGLKTSGWIRVPANKWDTNDVATTQIDAIANYRDIHPVSEEQEHDSWYCSIYSSKFRY